MLQTLPLSLTGYRRNFRRVVQPVRRRCVDARGRILRGRGGSSRVVTSAHQRKIDVFALLEVLAECGRAHLGQFRLAQLVMDVDNRSGVDAFSKMVDRSGRSGHLALPAMDIDGR